MDGQVAAIRDALDGDGFARPCGARVRGEVRVGALRPVPRRGRRDDRRWRRPARLPAGPRQPARGARSRSRLDVAEGADIVMVKPALTVPRRDRRRPARRSTCPSPRTTSAASTRWSRPRPSAAGSTDRRSALEQLTAIKRAGADFVLTYFAAEVAESLMVDTNLAWFERARRVIPSGVDSPVRSFASVGGVPFTVARGEGPWVYDVEGTRYLDFVQSYGAAAARPRHPVTVDAVRRQAGEGTHVRDADARRGPVRGGDRRARAGLRAGPARLVGHRGGDERGAASPAARPVGTGS